MAKQAGGASKRGIIKRSLDKLRKKIIPTFTEQHKKAKDAGKKEFTSTRDETKKGKLHYHTGTKEEAQKALKKESRREKAIRKTGQRKQVGLTDKDAAFKTARKSGKKTYMHKGKKYTTLLKGEKPNKWLPELSGKTSKKIKRVLKQHGGSAAQQHYTQHGYGPTKIKLIKGQPKLAVKGWN